MDSGQNHANLTRGTSPGFTLFLWTTGGGGDMSYRSWNRQNRGVAGGRPNSTAAPDRRARRHQRRGEDDASQRILRDALHIPVFTNADAIARGLNAFDPES